MKRQIFGRKVGSKEAFVLLIESGGVAPGGKIDPGTIEEFELANTRRQTQVFRDKGVEGYVRFEGDHASYRFTPDQDFTYPAIVH